MGYSGGRIRRKNDYGEPGCRRSGRSSHRCSPRWSVSNKSLKVKLHYIGTEYSPEAIGLLGFDGINLGYKRYKEEYNLKELQDSGLKSGAYVIDDPAIMRDFLDKKIDYITTNKPQVLLDLIAR